MSSRAALDAILRDMRVSVEQSRLAYQFNANSYTFSAMSSAHAAYISFDAYYQIVTDPERRGETYANRKWRRAVGLYHRPNS